MYAKQRDISSHRKAYKTYRCKTYHVILAPFSWYHKDPEAPNDFKSENWIIEDQEVFLENDLINTIKLMKLYEKKLFE